MDQATAETINKYQAEYDKNPKSKVFAPLADGLRKMGQLNQAMLIIKNGLKYHESFSGGHVVLGRIQQDSGQNEKALSSFLKATEFDQNNILAHKLLADSYLECRDIKKALSSYKMVLFLRPTDKPSLDKIKKLESLTADEFEDDSFKIKKINYATASISEAQPNRLLERALSLADAFLVRSEFEKSFNVLTDARSHFGEQQEIIKRLKLIEANTENSGLTRDHNLDSRKTVANNDNINHLNNILEQIEKRKR